MQISDAVIRGSRNKAEKKTKNRPKKDKNQKTAKVKKTALFRANKHLEKFIISNCRSV